MDWTTFFTTIIATFIGAWVGAWVIVKRQENKNKYPRKLLSDFLTTIKSYKTYDQAKNEFNKRSTVEKKAVLVALKNLGVPIKIDVVDDSFNVDDVQFDEKKVNKESIDIMLEFVEKGLCDELFFKEIGTDFYNAPPKIILARNLALKVLDALDTQFGKPGIQLETLTNANVAHLASLDWNQFEVVFVFWATVDIMENAKMSQSKIQKAKEHVKNGIFDYLFYWDTRAYNNMNAQRNHADEAIRRLQSVAVPTTSANESNQKVIEQQV